MLLFPSILLLATTAVHPFLEIPSDLNEATPVWHPDGANAEYVMLRTELKVTRSISARVAVVNSLTS